MSRIDPAILAHGGIVPDEVRRLRVEPGETLVIRIGPDRSFTPNQARENQQWLETAFLDIPVRVVVADEILLARLEEASDA